jgi:hypothetical protein
MQGENYVVNQILATVGERKFTTCGERPEKAYWKLIGEITL